MNKILIGVVLALTLSPIQIQAAEILWPLPKSPTILEQCDFVVSRLDHNYYAIDTNPTKEALACSDAARQLGKMIRKIDEIFQLHAHNQDNITEHLSSSIFNMLQSIKLRAHEVVQEIANYAPLTYEDLQDLQHTTDLIDSSIKEALSGNPPEAQVRRVALPSAIPLLGFHIRRVDSILAESIQAHNLRALFLAESIQAHDLLALFLPEQEEEENL
ncbi:MAG: hypothetical protein LBJ77_00080 [Holosporales bacterium]|jgi:hypothetical protein|nr:hypothetical protein [Holosporales bacterium]